MFFTVEASKTAAAASIVGTRQNQYNSLLFGTTERNLMLIPTSLSSFKSRIKAELFYHA